MKLIPRWFVLAFVLAAPVTLGPLARAAAWGTPRSVEEKTGPMQKLTLLPQASPGPPATMSDKEKQATYVNEPVILLTEDGRYPYDFYAEALAHGDGTFEFHVLGQPKKGLPYKSYAGKTGTIVELKQGRGRHSDLVVRLDGSGEQIVGSSGHLGFASDLKAAQALVGKTLWSRGSRQLVRPGRSRNSYSAEDHVKLKNTEKVTVSKVVWGAPYHPIVVCATTSAGQEGCAHLTHFEPRFAPLENVTPSFDVEAAFFSSDPRKDHPTWSAAIWQLIQDDEVAIGMTEEMARFACGPALERSGAVLSGGTVSPIYKCGNKRFLVEGGKVTKYVN